MLRACVVREVMGSIFIGNSDFFLSLARDKLNIPFSLFLHQAQHLIPYHINVTVKQHCGLPGIKRG